MPLFNKLFNKSTSHNHPNHYNQHDPTLRPHNPSFDHLTSPNSTVVHNGGEYQQQQQKSKSTWKNLLGSSKSVEEKREKELRKIAEKAAKLQAQEQVRREKEAKLAAKRAQQTPNHAKSMLMSGNGTESSKKVSSDGLVEEYTSFAEFVRQQQSQNQPPALPPMPADLLVQRGPTNELLPPPHQPDQKLSNASPASFIYEQRRNIKSPGALGAQYTMPIYSTAHQQNGTPSMNHNEQHLEEEKQPLQEEKYQQYNQPQYMQAAAGRDGAPSVFIPPPPSNPLPQHVQAHYQHNPIVEPKMFQGQPSPHQMQMGELQRRVNAMGGFTTEEQQQQQHTSPNSETSIESSASSLQRELERVAMIRREKRQNTYRNEPQQPSIDLDSDGENPANALYSQQQPTQQSAAVNGSQPPLPTDLLPIIQHPRAYRFFLTYMYSIYAEHYLVAAKSLEKFMLSPSLQCFYHFYQTYLQPSALLYVNLQHPIISQQTLHQIDQLIQQSNSRPISVEQLLPVTQCLIDELLSFLDDYYLPQYKSNELYQQYLDLNAATPSALMIQRVAGDMNSKQLRLIRLQHVVNVTQGHGTLRPAELPALLNTRTGFLFMLAYLYGHGKEDLLLAYKAAQLYKLYPSADSLRTYYRTFIGREEEHKKSLYTVECLPEGQKLALQKIITHTEIKLLSSDKLSTALEFVSSEILTYMQDNEFVQFKRSGAYRHYINGKRPRRTLQRHTPQAKNMTKRQAHSEQQKIKVIDKILYDNLLVGENYELDENDVQKQVDGTQSESETQSVGSFGSSAVQSRNNAAQQPPPNRPTGVPLIAVHQPMQYYQPAQARQTLPVQQPSVTHTVVPVWDQPRGPVPASNISYDNYFSQDDFPTAQIQPRQQQQQQQSHMQQPLMAQLQRQHSQPRVMPHDVDRHSQQAEVRQLSRPQQQYQPAEPQHFQPMPYQQQHHEMAQQQQSFAPPPQEQGVHHQQQQGYNLPTAQQQQLYMQQHSRQSSQQLSHSNPGSRRQSLHRIDENAALQNVQHNRRPSQFNQQYLQSPDQFPHVRSSTQQSRATASSAHTTPSYGPQSSVDSWSPEPSSNTQQRNIDAVTAFEQSLEQSRQPQAYQRQTSDRSLGSSLNDLSQYDVPVTVPRPVTLADNTAQREASRQISVPPTTTNVIAEQSMNPATSQPSLSFAPVTPANTTKLGILDASLWFDFNASVLHVTLNNASQLQPLKNPSRATRFIQIRILPLTDSNSKTKIKSKPVRGDTQVDFKQQRLQLAVDASDLPLKQAELSIWVYDPDNSQQSVTYIGQINCPILTMADDVEDAVNVQYKLRDCSWSWKQ